MKIDDGLFNVKDTEAAEDHLQNKLGLPALRIIESLEKSSLDWHRNENDYTPFMINFMQILYRCYKELDDRFIDGALHKAKKSERVRAVVLNSPVPISKQEIAEKVPDISVRTVELVLGQLQKKGEIKKTGSFRDEGKLYLLSFCFPYVECSSEGMWQIDPPIYLAGDGENRNPAIADYHVKIEMPEDYTAASAGTITAQNGIT